MTTTLGNIKIGDIIKWPFIKSNIEIMHVSLYDRGETAFSYRYHFGVQRGGFTQVGDLTHSMHTQPNSMEVELIGTN